MTAGSDNAPQRAYHAACSFCGATVEFRSAASACAVCSYCRSTLVRDGVQLRKVGESAALFDDHSPLQLGSAGRYLGEAFTLIGRVQWAHAAGTWNEWRALFDNGRTGWLAEDNAGHVFSFPAPLRAAPARDTLRAGGRCIVDGQDWSVASVGACTLNAAEGELDAVPRAGEPLTLADLRNDREEVGTLEYREGRPVQWSVGRAVALTSLALTGTRERSEQSVAGRGLECPSCGAALTVTLESTRTVVCGQCHAVVDVSQGIGADLGHYRQAQGDHEPVLSLGSVGRLGFGDARPVPWQVVGYQERRDLPPSGSDDEQTFWREYLLYNRDEGFVFLVDSDEGWSWMRPLTGAPTVTGTVARWRGERYVQRWPERPWYEAETVFVLGEFYWPVRRGERLQVTDYAGQGPARGKLLSWERGADEVVWSGGEAIAADRLAAAFALSAEQARALRRDAQPLASLGGGPAVSPKLVIGLVLLVLAVILLVRCSRDDCDAVRQQFGADSAEFRQCQSSARVSGSSGGSWGGYSSGGGGHK